MSRPANHAHIPCGIVGAPLVGALCGRPTPPRPGEREQLGNHKGCPYVRGAARDGPPVFCGGGRCPPAMVISCSSFSLPCACGAPALPRQSDRGSLRGLGPHTRVLPIDPIEPNHGVISRLDPIRFEVIRNALVEATEEMSVSLRRSAYSTNIKTRNDFSCAVFDRRLRAVAQAFNQPNHLAHWYTACRAWCAPTAPTGSDRGTRSSPTTPIRGSPSQRHYLHFAPFPPGPSLWLCRQPGPPRGCRGWSPGQCRGLPGGVSGGVIIPPVKVVENGGAGEGCLSIGPGSDPLQARDRRRLSGPGGRQPYRDSPVGRPDRAAGTGNDH